MNRTVSAAEANRRFSSILGEVKRGASVTVTSHGRPVARIVPPEDEPAGDDRAAARERLHALLKEQPLTVIPWTRDELHDD